LRPQHYLLALRGDGPGPGRGPATELMIDASGYTRAELLAMVASMRPLDMQSWRAQQALFPQQPGIEPQARDALLAALEPAAPPAPGQLIYWRSRHYMRQNSAPDTLPDPYHQPRYNGLPATTVQELWVQALDGPAAFATLRQIRGEDGSLYLSGYTGPQ